MKSLVTGATGFLGRNLVDELLKRGDEVTALVRDPSTSGLPDQVKLVRGDVTNEDTLNFSEQDVVYHLAGVVGYSKAAREEMERVNVTGTRNVLGAIRKFNVQRLIYMSSVVAVGASRGKKVLNEESKYNLSRYNLGYFETKKAAEEAVIEDVKKGRLSAVCVNPSTIYGPGDMTKGSRRIQLKVAKGKFPFYPPGGVNVVDVQNVVDATINAVENGRNGERYILAGENITIRQLFSHIAKAAGKTPPFIRLSKSFLNGLGRVGDFLESIDKKGPINSENARVSTMYHWFDPSKAEAELSLNKTDVSESIGRSISWARDQGLLD